MEKLAIVGLSVKEREALLKEAESILPNGSTKELLLELVETVNKLLKGNISIGEIRKLLGLELKKSKKEKEA